MKSKFYIFDPGANKWFALPSKEHAIAAYVLHTCNDARYTLEVPDHSKFKEELESRSLMITDGFTFVSDREENDLEEFELFVNIEDNNIFLFNSAITVLYKIIKVIYGKSVIKLKIEDNGEFNITIRPLDDNDTVVSKMISFDAGYLSWLLKHFFSQKTGINF